MSGDGNRPTPAEVRAAADGLMDKVRAEGALSYGQAGAYVQETFGERFAQATAGGEAVPSLAVASEFAGLAAGRARPTSDGWVWQAGR